MSGQVGEHGAFGGQKSDQTAAHKRETRTGGQTLEQGHPFQFDPRALLFPVLLQSLAFGLRFDWRAEKVSESIRCQAERAAERQPSLTNTFVSEG